MGNIWDLPEQKHPVHGRKSRRIQRKQRQAPEQDMVSGTNQMLNTATNFMFGAAALGMMAGIGGAVISSIKK
jgi:hypothetical protein